MTFSILSTGRFASFTLCGVSALMLTACTVSREAQLRKLGDKVESNLKSEQSKVLNLNDSTKQARLEHLTNLRYQLSAANVARGAIPRVVPPEFKDPAYDVIEEVYGAIDWNIPLGPNDIKKPLPSAFTNNSLLLGGNSFQFQGNGLVPGKPGTGSGSPFGGTGGFVK